MKPEVIKRHIIAVLDEVPRRKAPPRDRAFLSAYQILDRLPVTVRDYLLDKYGAPGKGNSQGSRASAVSAISRILSRMVHVDKVLIDARGLRVLVADADIAAGNEYGFNLYRLRA